MKYEFTDRDRKYGKRVGVKKGGSFRCFDCFDFSFYDRDAHAGDLEEKCAYCQGPIFISPGQILVMEAAPKVNLAKRPRKVNLAKSHVQSFPLLSMAFHLRNRLDLVSFAYDKARQRIAELEAQLSEREDSRV
ncbi:hypothetical protein ACFYY2_07565 [Streptomyces sp. NPDC001822]|uniref:hypothetical protein n=1 Tax=Streptomyces sp. NPDC001822 TaxID=3364614 RepID=UPI00369F28E9